MDERLKNIGAYTFCEDVAEVLMSSNLPQYDFLLFDEFSNEMKSYIDVLGPCTDLLYFCNGDGRIGVCKDWDWQWNFKVETLQNSFYVQDLLCHF